MASRSTYSFLSLTLITLTYVALCSPLPVTFAAQYNVVSLGAVADGKTDSSKAFLDAWASACSSSGPSTVYVPMGSFYVKAAAFNGPCKSNFITFMIDGTLLASSNYGMIGNSANWIIFRHVTGLNVYGGTFNGQGSGLWACKKSGKSCPGGATNIQFSNSKDIFVSGLSSVNSQTFHIVVNGCQNVTLQGVQVTASGASPNTDGIHVSQSTSVTILNSRIGTGDDCVSIGPGASNLWIENVACGPGHGISIGSLGQNSQEAGVQNVTVKTVTFTGTQNGLRIKSWARPSNGFVRNILFQHAVMNNVQNPIIIDQHYCPGNVGCPTQASGIKISDVTYQDIQGTSATAVAVKFDCSSMNPCTGIKLQDVKLTYGSQVAQASCAHAGGMASGFMQPSSCL
ncbi:hypothetical protein SAY87_006618 [Trapa incisa]|uniref:Polygalacturonase n=1 Tax=Trapa incisa TaxID=236973 RepID=A0AAN7JYY7_9MYRT|nr:hypothetical protein SAY87_006618 [Trapa incisa]